MVCLISVRVYGLPFSLFFFLIIGIIPSYAIYYRKIYFYSINFGFPISNQDKWVGCNFFYLFSLIGSFYFFIIVLICFIFNPFCICGFISPYFFLMLYGKEQAPHSLQVILNYLIFITITFTLDVFKVYNFLFYLRIIE